MNWTRRTFGGALCALVAAAAGASTAHAQDAIRIGEINSYTALPAFTEPYRKGWRLALERSTPPAASTGA
jgi:branched-chain amino acid transport system substrate-binding protein